MDRGQEIAKLNEGYDQYTHKEREDKHNQRHRQKQTQQVYKTLVLTD